MGDSQPWCVPVAAGPCSRACPPPPCSPALPVGKHWMLMLEVSPFQDQRLWLSTAMMLLWQDTLDYLTGACRGGGEERLRVSSSMPSPSRGVWGLHPVLEGREMASLFTGLLCPVWGWPEMSLNVPLYMVLFWVLHWCYTSKVLSLVLMSVEMAVVDLCVCWLDHLAPPVYFAFFYSWVSFLCALEGELRGTQMKAET